MHLPEHVIVKIHRGSYVEFNSLLPNQPNQEPLAKRLRIVAGQEDNDGGGLTVAVPAARQRMVDLPTRLEAWTIFL